MGTITVEGVGTVQIAGDVPTPEEADAIARAVSSGEVGTAQGMGRAFVQGGTFGLGDELVAGGVATRNWLGNALGAPETFGSVPGKSWSDVYDASLNAERNRLDAFREDSPVLAYGSEIVGALPAAIATGGTGTATTLGGRMLAGGANAAAQGIVYGFNAGEGGLGNRAGNAVLSGAVAAPLGAAVPAIGAGVRSLTAQLMQKRAADILGMPPAALNLLRRTMNVDDSLTGVGQQRIQAAGPDAMLADAGPMAQQVLDTAIQSSGPAGAMARQAIDSRVANAAQQVTSTLDNTLGKPAGIVTTETALRTGSAAARQQAYRAAYAQPIDYTSEVGRALDEIVSTRVPQEAIAAANKLMRAELGRGSRQIMAEVADDGTVAFRSMPDVQQLDYITRGLNEVADAANGQGALGGTTAVGRVYSNLSREIRDLLKDAVPEYATALQTAAEPIQARNALRLGGDILSAGMTRDEVASMVQGMTPVERSFVAQGIRSQIDDAMANVRAAFTDNNMDAREAAKALRDLSSRAAREKVEMVIGKNAADQLFADFDQAAAAYALRAAVADNSKTFARQEAQRTMQAQVNDGPINALRSGEPLNASRRLAQLLLGRTEADKLNLTDQTATALVRALTENRGQDAVNILLRMQGVQQMLAPIEANGGRLTQALLRPLAAPVGQPLAQGLR